MLNSKYEELNRDDLNVGDVVYVLRYPTFGWAQSFRKPIAIKHVIAKFTPKRTKITTEAGVELDKNCTLYKMNEDLAKDNEIAKAFQYFCNHNEEITPNLLRQLSDDTVVNVSKLLREMKTIIEHDEQFIKIQENNKK